MAQTEDTELRDLVIEALEKNGSLAKIRALLRANIFLAFEDDCENLKKNDTFVKVLQLPEGKFCLSIIHEFLEFCNLRNTLFVYKAETRQGKEYNYDSVNTIADKLNISKFDRENEPILLTLLKNCLKASSKASFNQSDKQSGTRRQCRGKINFKDDQNPTYIVKEDSSTNTSHTQSDNSSDEKNKIDLRLTLDNSDTDTSSDSTRGQTRSEYIPNKHINAMNTKMNDNRNVLDQPHQQSDIKSNYNYVTKSNELSEKCLHDLKVINNSSTESTSYAELKPFNMLDTVLLNTPGLPFEEVKKDLKQTSPHNSNSTASKIESLSPSHTLNSISLSKKEISHQDSKASIKNSSGKSGKYDEYSYDFTSPPLSGRRDGSDKSPRSGLQNSNVSKSNNTSIESNQQNSPSSQSSISLSDVADLLSDRSNKKLSPSNISSRHRLRSEKFNRSPIKDHTKLLSDDSGDFSESPIPSLSNLSLDIHSD
ncbi:dentin sialophosphoprotein-like [Bicyclus anynana]|uniref:Dentin sialophosphoprotein-like n=1 Tax=Bicyclus anynana TaxID=110368 RepID=A0A6J1N210_BICAN|nr:dentin sialophosphoprotein-like [Bicyclus anynana]